MARRKGRERGASLVLVAASIVALLAAASLAVDLGLLYVARSEAQQAADAAALAGASAFLSSGCTSLTGGCVAGGAQETLARQQAEATGAQNYVLRQAASIEDSDVTFSYPNPQEPQVTVTVQRTLARQNAVPTLFARLFGVSLVNVSAKATAEAFNPSGGSVPVGYNCVVPFLVPNCDPTHTSPLNGGCGGTAGYFIDPTTKKMKNPGTYPSGATGQPWALHSNAGPSQWYLVAYGNTSLKALQSGSLLRNYISECAPVTISCGDQLMSYDGKSVGPVDQGVNTRIHAIADGPNNGQDTIDTSVGPPFPITGGSNNPNPDLRGKTFYKGSDSMVLAPVYQGGSLASGGQMVTVVGFMQLFIRDVVFSGRDDKVDAVVLKVIGCGDNSEETSPPSIIGETGSPIPIRLIRTQ
jgi:Flp pilus assembly protein TadG